MHTKLFDSEADMVGKATTNERLSNSLAFRDKRVSGGVIKRVNAKLIK